MTDYQAQLEQVKNKLEKALKHLEYSWTKVQELPFEAENLTEDQLATWESFSARFARLSDLFLSRYIRTFSLTKDPGFRGSLRDYLNIAEKYGLICETKRWLSIRELRNITAHEYNENDLSNYFHRIFQETPFLIDAINQVLRHADI